MSFDGRYTDDVFSVCAGVAARRAEAEPGDPGVFAAGQPPGGPLRGCGGFDARGDSNQATVISALLSGTAIVVLAVAQPRWWTGLLSVASW